MQLSHSAKRPGASQPRNPKRFKQDEPEKSSYEVELEKHGHQTDHQSKWPRPPLPMDIKKKSIAVQVFDIETFHEPGGESFERTNVRLFGVTMDGNSVCATVTDYFPHFYFQAPPSFCADHLDTAQKVLNTLVANAMKKTSSTANFSEQAARNFVHLKLVKGDSIYYFKDGERNFSFIKVTGTVNALNKLKSELKNMMPNLMGTGSIKIDNLFEANIDAEIKFMAHSGIVGCGWVEIPPEKATFSKYAISRCQLELSVSINDLVVHEPEGQWSNVAPIRTLSFDIECMGRRGVFPEPDKDPVIQIANMVKVEGQNEPFIRNCFVLGSCAPVIGSHIIQCANEEELLTKWAEFVREVDPDILTGYNILNFDLPFILDRAKTLKIPTVALLGRLKDRASTVRDAALASKQMGSRVNKSIDIHGRVIFDVLQVVIRDYKLRSYTLNSVSFHFLSEQKEDVEHNIIPDLQQGDEQTRRRLAIYCMKDAALPLRLLDKLMSVINYMEMARVTGVPINYLLTRGQQIKILSMMLRRCKVENLFLPVIENQGNAGEGYEGATVIDPQRGFYNEPIATLDFASLYPSIMIAHNLCYTTLLKKPEGEEGKDYVKTPSGNFFVTKERQQGLLPIILQDLLAARKRAKNEMKHEKDDFKKMVLNGRQLALKVSANSVYGFTGAINGKLPCLEISQSVTAFGREMIDMTKTEVEKRFKKGAMDGKCPEDAKVIYGDTDSVMVKFGVKTVAEAMQIGLYAATEVSKIFIAPIKLEFEKVYFPYLLINKKRYAGLYFTKPDEHDKMDCKGLETVRRDNCPLVAKVLGTCLETLLIDRDANAALDYAKRIIADLLFNRIDISMLIISKELTRAGDKYQAKQAHVELATRMRKRDPGSAPRLGDRVPYVIITAAKNVPAYEKAEDPIYVLQNNIPIDNKHYLTNQLAKPLARIFEPILGDKAEKILTEGEHTRVQKVVQSKVGGLAKFTKQQATCLGCRSVLKGADKAVCQHCAPKLPKIYNDKVNSLNEFENQFARLWTECQNCARTVQEKVNCSARDCPIYYMRQKVRNDLTEAYNVLKRFGEPTWGEPEQEW